MTATTKRKPTQRPATKTTKTKTKDRPHGRHAAPKTKHRKWPWIVLTIILLLVVLAAVFWFLPADMIPESMVQTDTCTVSAGGTLVVDTDDCGRFYYRGHVDLWQWYQYDVRHTGPLAWEFDSIEQTAYDGG